MKIAIASDHAGYEIKTAVAAYLRDRGIEVVDHGCGPGETVDYVEYGAKAAMTLSAGAVDRAVLVCGTGLGMGIVANKFKGVRATPCWSEFATEMSRRHNDSNCLTFGGRTHSSELALRLVGLWLDTPFDGGRHGRRVQMIRDIEDVNFK